MTKREMKRIKARNTRIALIVCLMLVVCIAAVGGTIAWLQDSTKTITNTFTTSNLSVELEEAGAQANADNSQLLEQSFQLIPGVAITKDPEVTASGNVPFYVFVKETKVNWNDNLTYSVDEASETNPEGWTKLTGVTDTVYYYLVDDAVNGTYSITDKAIISGDVVNVSQNMTIDDMQSIGNNLPQLSYQAYAIQQQDGGSENNGNFTALEAWQAVSGN